MKPKPITPKDRTFQALALAAQRYFDKHSVNWRDSNEQAEEFATIASAWLVERATELLEAHGRQISS